MKPLTRSLILPLFLLTTVFAMETEGNRPLTAQDLWAFKRVGAPALSPDGKTVVFPVQEWSIDKNKSTANLWLVDVASGKSRRLTAASAGDRDPDWSPDGTRIAFVSKRGDDEADALYVIRVDGGESGKVIELPYSMTAPKWMPDGRRIVAATRVIPELAGELQKSDLAAIRKEVKRRKDSKMTAKVTEHRQYRYWDQSLTDNLAHRLVLVDVDSKEVRDLTTVVFLNETFSRPAELFALDSKTGSTRQLTHFNDDLLAKLDFGKVESHTFTGAGGHQIQQWLIYPPNYDPGKKYPLVQLLHGGPHTMVRDAFSYRWNAHLFAAPGYFVSWVNRHGSTGFGEAFTLSIHGEWGEKPLADIMRSTDYLLEKLPNIDPDRLAAAGASYGGYLAAWILGHTDRFKCIVDHASVNNFYTQFGGDLTSYVFDSEVLGGTPWENVEGMQRNNPMFYAKNFKTPTLVIHGEQDYRVPYGNGLELYGVLQAMGIPSRFLLYPNENHWVLSPPEFDLLEL